MPEALCRLSRLQELLLACNELSGLPAWVGALPQLRVLNLQHNRLRRLPAAVLCIKGLQYLRWGAQKPSGDAPEAEEAAGVAAAVEVDAAEDATVAAEAAVAVGDLYAEAVADAGEEAAGAGFGSPSLTVLELEANGQIALPPLHPSATVLTALLASYNRLGAVPRMLVQHGHSLKKLHLGCNGVACVAEALPCLTASVV